ncbi:hypothetical protein, partial [Serratia marcescens]|uniref:hypothetical protein n=1 Tax=Serratia marcescens TaxID=615 RepID=UPI0011E7D2FC
MNKKIFAPAGLVLCLLLSACTSDQMKAEHKSERQALNTKQQADRQEARAEKELAASTAATA